MFQYKILESVLSGSAGFSSADVQVVRAAAFNQILDPWVYILLRRSLFRKVRGGLSRLLRCKDSGGCGGRSTTTGQMVSGRPQKQAVSLLGADHVRCPGIVLDVVRSQGPLQVDPHLQVHGAASATSRHRSDAHGEPSADPTERQSLVKAGDLHNGTCPTLSEFEISKSVEPHVHSERSGACEHTLSPSHTSIYVTADVCVLSKEDVSVYK